MNAIDSVSNVSRLQPQSGVANEPKASAVKTREEAPPSSVVHLSRKIEPDTDVGYGHLSDRKNAGRSPYPADVLKS